MFYSLPYNKSTNTCSFKEIYFENDIKQLLSCQWALSTKADFKCTSIINLTKGKDFYSYRFVNFLEIFDLTTDTTPSFELNTLVC